MKRKAPRARRSLPRFERLDSRLLLATYLVTDPGDNGDDAHPIPNSLRQAIELANAAPGTDQIRFSLAATPATITPIAPLPRITGPIDIDGGSAVVLDGSKAGSGVGLYIVSGGSTVQNLAIQNFPGAAIRLAGGGGNLVQHVAIGTDLSGTTAAGNGTGVFIDGSSNNRLVNDLMSANGGDGIRITGGASGNVVLACAIGVVGSGSSALGNGGDGVDIIDSPGNSIGKASPPIPGQLIDPANANVISANGGVGVRIVGHAATSGGAGNTASGNAVLGNLIGTDFAGARGLGNTLDGVFVDGASGATIGGTSGVGNLISANGRFGVAIAGGSAVGALVQGNRIGTNIDGTGGLGNGADGVFVGSGGTANLDPQAPDPASGVTIGGATAGERNLISGNRQNGVNISGLAASGDVVQGNYIGTDASGSGSLGNGADGVLMSGASGNTVGGAASGAGNLISGNGASGVEIVGAPSLNAQGVTVGASGSANLIAGNIIGLDAANTKAIGNLQHGVSLNNAGSNTLGGTTAAVRNVISGNNLTGVNIQGVLSTANRIQGNYIGTDATGTNGTSPTQGQAIKVGNRAEGVFLIDASNNAIGGDQPGEGNVISGNGTTGVTIAGNPILGPGGSLAGNTATGNRIQGNEIGLDVTGLQPILNNSDGILINDASSNTIGGTTAGARNVIANNSGNGIQLLGRPVFDPANAKRAIGNLTSGNVVQGNYVGTTANGDGAGANRNAGVLVFAANDNTIGGTAAGAGNVLSGNLGSGLEIGGGAFGFPNPMVDINATATRNVVLGNLIGTTSAGNLPLGNGSSGVTIHIGAAANTIGGTAVGAGNVISANFGSGVAIVQGDEPGVQANAILGNRIGTDAAGKAVTTPDGTRRLGNIADGVLVSGSARNTIAFNTIAGNQIGVEVDNATATGNAIYGNLVGTDSAGLVALANAIDGVLISNAPGNTIGLVDALNPDGSIAGPLLGNLISGNQGVGVLILGAGSTNNALLGNLIGTNLTGRAPLGNLQGGVLITDASNNTIGGAAPGARNLISANLAAGIQVQSSDPVARPVAGNQVVGNFLGTDVVGDAFPGAILPRLGNAGDGLRLSNAVGSFVSGNLISGNSGSGIDVVQGSSNLLAGNRIGTDATGLEAIGNAASGVTLNNTSGNVIGGFGAVARNVISGNAGDGVTILGPLSAFNVVVGNFIGTDLAGRHATYSFGADGVLGTADDQFVGNGLDGVRVQDAGAFNTIAANVLSANLIGVEVIRGGFATPTLIQSNVIGLDSGGAGALGNVYGVFLNNAVGAVVGGAAPGSGNVISGNTAAGVVVSFAGTGASGDAILGNLIGTDASGLAAPAGPQQPVGVFVNAAPNVTIGGTTPGSRNVISANSNAGISIFGQASGLNLNTQIQGNLIGTTAFGAPLLGPGRAILQQVGVAINASAGNVIGGLVPSARNTIVGNAIGVEIAGIVEKLANPTAGNVVVGNSIDTNGFGVFVNGSRGNAILGNDLSFNTMIGLSIVGPSATGNTAQSNTIVGNFNVGVYIDGASGNTPGNTPNVVRNDTIARNGQVGVYLARGASGNLVEQGTVAGPGQQYGVFLFNSAGNVPGVIRSGPMALRFSGNSIANFREFTGPAAPAPTSSTLTTLAAAPTATAVPAKTKARAKAIRGKA